MGQLPGQSTSSLTITSSSLILTSDVATMVAWSLKKKEAEKKPDPKAAALPFYKRFTYPFTRKQTLLGLLIFSLILSVLAVVTWYVVTSWSCCRRGFTPASTPSPPPFSSAKG